MTIDIFPASLEQELELPDHRHSRALTGASNYRHPRASSWRSAT
jgi:hypothetical protein